MRFAPWLRTFDILMVALLVGVVFWTFKVKNDSQIALDKVSELQRQIEAERTEIDLLKSDWGLLTSPKRLEQLVERYGLELGLEPMGASQLADETSLPAMREKFDPQIDDPEFAGTDQSVNTGSVETAPQEGRQ